MEPKTIKLLKLVLTYDDMTFKVREAKVTSVTEDHIMYHMEGDYSGGCHKCQLDNCAVKCRVGDEISAFVWTTSDSPMHILSLKEKLMKLIGGELHEKIEGLKKERERVEGMTHSFHRFLNGL